ncbi:hypothetical protein Tco_1003259 [Tanacetum coccineum]|uniref:Uncharacterized protein n=1 Tax=Tanacetum coccineum TaxID=301880 RepID=A0ABQ5F8T9_9ASTR
MALIVSEVVFEVAVVKVEVAQLGCAGRRFYGLQYSWYEGGNGEVALEGSELRDVAYPIHFKDVTGPKIVIKTDDRLMREALKDADATIRLKLLVRMG